MPRRLRFGFFGRKSLPVSTAAFAVTPNAVTLTYTPVSSSGKQTFAQRIAAAGVVRYRKFNTTADLGYVGDPTVTIPPVGVFCNGGASPANLPTIDTTVFPSGTGSLKFTIASGSNESSAGQFYMNFSDDHSVQYGEGDTFYIQWRQRFNQAFVDTYFLDSLGGFQSGIKQMIVGKGDQTGVIALSHSDIEIVTQTYHQHRFSRLYSDKDDGAGGRYSPPYEEPYGGSDFKLQNAMAAPYCRYSSTTEGGGSYGTVTVPPECFPWVADEWMTFQLGVSLGTWNSSTQNYDNSTVKLWGARDGGDSYLLLDWNPTVSGYFPPSSGTPSSPHQKFGKLWLLPFMTDKSVSQSHSACYTWYDELIVSTQKIADPVGTYPAWRAAGLTKDTVYSIAGTGSMAHDGTITTRTAGSTLPGVTPQMMGDCWDGFAVDGTGAKLIAVAPGGDKLVGQNGVHKLDLTADAPLWTNLYLGVNPVPYTGDGSPVAAPANSIYPDGNPRGHQTYNHQYYDETRNAVLMFYIAAPFGNISGHSDVIRAFYLGTNRYDSAANGDGPFGSTKLDLYGSRICATMARDPRNGNVYFCSNSSYAGVWKNDATQFGTLNTTQFLSGFGAWNFRHSCIDTARDRWVYFMNGKLEYVNIANPDAMTYGAAITITGPNTGSGAFDFTQQTYGPVSAPDTAGWYIYPIYDDINDRYIVFTGDRSPSFGYSSTDYPGYIWFIDAQTNAVTNRISIPAPKNGWNSRVGYISKYRCIVWLTDYASDFNFLPLVNN